MGLGIFMSIPMIFGQRTVIGIEPLSLLKNDYHFYLNQNLGKKSDILLLAGISEREEKIDSSLISSFTGIKLGGEIRFFPFRSAQKSFGLSKRLRKIKCRSGMPCPSFRGKDVWKEGIFLGIFSQYRFGEHLLSTGEQRLEANKLSGFDTGFMAGYKLSISLLSLGANILGTETSNENLLPNLFYEPTLRLGLNIK